MNIIETHDLCKQYGNALRVAHLDLDVPEGSVYGFLGPNGAGKSTTLKMILGLVRPTAGSIQVLGQNMDRANRLSVLRQVGSLIESPSYYGHLTGEENLRIVQTLRGVPEKNIREVLQIVRLDGQRGKKVAHYSLGMKQRLGLALALSLSSFTRFSAACAGVREDTLRLHILANSDSEADQELKLAVRDAILQAEGGMFAAERTKEGALRAAGADLEAIRAVAQRTVRARGYSYPVAVRLENMYFSTREYDGFTLPAGRYDAVRVEIGAHAGKNWFCVLFPPMCVPAATSDGGQDMSAYSGAEQQAVCSSYKVGFAAVEWLEGLKESLSGQGVRTLAEADGQAEQDDEAQEEPDGAEQDARRADKKETASRAGTEHSGGRTVTTADRTQAQAARTAD